MKKSILSVVLILAMIFCLMGCTTYDNFKAAYLNKGEEAEEAAPVIRIGVYEPLTGKYRQFGKDEVIGIELAHEVRPTVLGMDVELIYADNCSNMYDAETALAELSKYSPNGILGSYGDVLTVTAADYVVANSIPAITITATNPLITVNTEYYFTATFSKSQQGDALADYAMKNMLRESFATVKTARNDEATEIVMRFTDRIEEMSESKGNILGAYIIDAQATDFSGCIQTLKETGASCVLLAAPVNASELFMKQCADAEYYPLFLGNNDWDTEEMEKFLRGSDSINAAYASTIAAEDTGLSQLFQEKFHTKYGKYVFPTGAMATAFDSYLLMLKAIEDAYDNAVNADIEALAAQQATEAEAKALRTQVETIRQTRIPTGAFIRNAMREINDYKGASGVLSYNGKNEVTKSITVRHFRAGDEMPSYVMN